MHVILYKGQKMLINLSDVFNTAGKVQETEIPVEMDTFSGSMGSYKLLEGGTLKIVAEGISKGRARVSGSVKLVFEGNCDRCLKETPVSLDISFERQFASPEFVSDDEDENEIEVIKQSAAVAIYMFPNMIVVMGLVVLMVFLGMKMDHRVLTLIMIAIAAILSGACYLRVLTLAKKER